MKPRFYQRIPDLREIWCWFTLTDVVLISCFQSKEPSQHNTRPKAPTATGSTWSKRGQEAISTTVYGFQLVLGVPFKGVFANRGKKMQEIRRA